MGYEQCEITLLSVQRIWANRDMTRSRWPGCEKVGSEDLDQRRRAVRLIVTITVPRCTDAMYPKRPIGSNRPESMVIIDIFGYIQSSTDMGVWVIILGFGAVREPRISHDYGM